MVSFKRLSKSNTLKQSLIASTLFFLIIRSETQCIEVGAATLFISYTIAAGAINILLRGKDFSNWWNRSQKSSTELGHPTFDPNCPRCSLKNPLNQSQMKTHQAPETTASQVVINQTTNNTTITAAEGNTINVLPPTLTAMPTPTQFPQQTIKAFQESLLQPAAQELQNTDQSPKDTTQTGLYPNRISNKFHSLQEFYENNYGKLGIAVAISGYVYILYLINSLQRYLTDPKRISLWFSEYDLNKLLLLEPDQMKELLIQEFINIYQVSDPKSLKIAVSKFLNDIEAELKSLAYFENIAGTINSLSLITENCCSPLCYLARNAIPGSGLIIDLIPGVTINNLFFINSKLKMAIQERISRIHYYKNIFLQTTIVV
ncbi:MAG: hypothetical protein K2X90_01815 [Candidatus Babeliaceae bacterium]|nr:hypothetical protein [Candidatus Babeliaceae bacterium]